MTAAKLSDLITNKLFILRLILDFLVKGHWFEIDCKFAVDSKN